MLALSLVVSTLFLVAVLVFPSDFTVEAAKGTVLVFKENEVLESEPKYFDDSVTAVANKRHPSNFLLIDSRDSTVHSFAGEFTDGAGPPCHRRLFETVCAEGSFGVEYGQDCVINNQPCRKGMCIGKSQVSVAQHLEGVGTVKKAVSTLDSFAVLSENGLLVSWGGYWLSPGVSSHGFVDVVSNMNAFAALTSAGTVHTWGVSGAGGSKCRSRSLFPHNYNKGPIRSAGEHRSFERNKDSWLESYACFQSDVVNKKATILDNLATNKIVSIHSSGAAFVAVNEVGHIIPWGNADVGGALGTSALSIVSEWINIRKSAGAGTMEIRVYENDYGFLARIGPGSKSAWEALAGEDLPNFVVWGLHSNSDAWDVKRGSAANVKFIYDDVCSTAHSFVTRSEDSYVLFTRQHITRGGQLSSFNISETTSTCVENADVLGVLSTGHELLLLGKFARDSAGPFSTSPVLLQDIKDAKVNSGALIILYNDLRVTTHGQYESGGNSSATPLPQIFGVQRVFADKQNSFALYRNQNKSVEFLGKMNKTIPSSYGCELNGNVETIFEGASTLAVKKTCNIMGMRCTICTDEKRLVNITSIDVKTYDPVNSVNGEEVIFSPEFYPGTLRPGTVGYKTEITESTLHTGLKINLCTGNGDPYDIYVHLPNQASIRATHVANSACREVILQNYTSFTVGVEPSGSGYEFQLTTIKRFPPKANGVICTLLPQNKYDCSAGVNITDHNVTVRYGAGYTKVYAHFPEPGFNVIKGLVDSNGPFDVQYAKPAIREVIFRDRNGQRLSLSSVFDDAQHNYSVLMNGNSTALYVGAISDDGWVSMSVDNAIGEVGVIQHQIGPLNGQTPNAFYLGEQKIEANSDTVCSKIPISSRMYILPNDALPRNAGQFSLPPHAPFAIFNQIDTGLNRPIDVRVPVEKRSQGPAPDKYVLGACKEFVGDIALRAAIAIKLDVASIVTKTNKNAISLNGNLPIKLHGVVDFVQAASTSASLYVDGSVSVFDTNGKVTWPNDKGNAKTPDKSYAIPDDRCGLREDVSSLVTTSGSILGITRAQQVVVAWVSSTCDCRSKFTEAICKTHTGTVLEKFNYGGVFVPGLRIGENPPIRLAMNSVIRAVGNIGKEGCGSVAFVENSGMIKMWGELGTFAPPLVPVKASSVVASDNAFAAISSVGGVGLAWGSAAYGGSVTQDVACNLASGVQDIFAINDTFVAIVELNGVNRIVTWPQRQLSSYFIPPPAALLSGRSPLAAVVDVYTNDCAFAARLEDGSVYTWGYKDCGADSTHLASGLRNVTRIVSNRKAFAALVKLCINPAQFLSFDACIRAGNYFDGPAHVWGNSKFGGNPNDAKKEWLSTGIKIVYADESSFVVIPGTKKINVNAHAKTVSIKHEFDGVNLKKYFFRIIRSSVFDIILSTSKGRMEYFPSFQPGVETYEALMYEESHVSLNVAWKNDMPLEVKVNGSIITAGAAGNISFSSVGTTTVGIKCGDESYTINIFTVYMHKIKTTFESHVVPTNVIHGGSSYDPVSAGNQNAMHLQAPRQYSAPTFYMEATKNSSHIYITTTFSHGIVKILGDSSIQCISGTATAVPIGVGTTTITLTYTPTSGNNAIASPKYILVVQKKAALLGLSFTNGRIDDTLNKFLSVSQGGYNLTLDWQENSINFDVYRSSDIIEARYNNVVVPISNSQQTTTKQSSHVVAVCNRSTIETGVHNFSVGIPLSNESIFVLSRKRTPMTNIAIKDNFGVQAPLDRAFNIYGWNDTTYTATINPSAKYVDISLTGTTGDTFVNGVKYIAQNPYRKAITKEKMSFTINVTALSGCGNTAVFSVVLTRPGPVSCIEVSEYAAEELSEMVLNSALLSVSRSLSAFRYNPHFDATKRTRNVIVNDTISHISVTMVSGAGTWSITSDSHHATMSGHVMTTTTSSDGFVRVHIRNLEVPTRSTKPTVRAIILTHSDTSENYTLNIARVGLNVLQYRNNVSAFQALPFPSSERFDETHGQHGLGATPMMAATQSPIAVAGMYVAYINVPFVTDVRFKDTENPISFFGNISSGVKSIADPNVSYAAYTLFSPTELANNVSFTYNGSLHSSFQALAKPAFPVNAFVPGGWGQSGTMLAADSAPLSNSLCDGEACVYAPGTPYAHRVRVLGMKSMVVTITIEPLPSNFVGALILRLLDKPVSIAINTSSANNYDAADAADSFRTAIKNNRNLNASVFVSGSGKNITLTARFQGVRIVPSTTNSSTFTILTVVDVSATHYVQVKLTNAFYPHELITAKWNGSKTNAEIADVIVDAIRADSNLLAASTVGPASKLCNGDLLGRSNPRTEEIHLQYKDALGKHRPLSLSFTSSKSVFVVDGHRHGVLDPTYYNSPSAALSAELWPGVNPIHVLQKNNFAREATVTLITPLVTQINLKAGISNSNSAQLITDKNVEDTFSFSPSFTGESTGSTVPRTWYMKKLFNANRVGVKISLHQKAIRSPDISIRVRVISNTFSAWETLTEYEVNRTWIQAFLSVSAGDQSDVNTLEIQIQANGKNVSHYVTITQPPIKSLKLTLGGTSRVITYQYNELSTGMISGNTTHVITASCTETLALVEVDRRNTGPAFQGATSALYISGTGGGSAIHAERPNRPGVLLAPTVVVNNANSVSVQLLIGHNQLVITLKIKPQSHGLVPSEKDDAVIRIFLTIKRQACIANFAVRSRVALNRFQPDVLTPVPLSKTINNMSVQTDEHMNTNGIYTIYVPKNTVQFDIVGAPSQGTATVENMTTVTLSTLANNIAPHTVAVNTTRSDLTNGKAWKSFGFAPAKFKFDVDGLRLDILTSLDGSFVSVWIIRNVLHPMNIDVQDSKVCGSANSMFSFSSAAACFNNNAGCRFTANGLEDHRIANIDIDGVTAKTPINLYTNSKFFSLKPSTTAASYPSLYYFDAAVEQTVTKTELVTTTDAKRGQVQARFRLVELGLNWDYNFLLYKSSIMQIFIQDNAGSTPCTVIPGNVWREALNSQQGVTKCRLTPSATEIAFYAIFNDVEGGVYLKEETSATTSGFTPSVHVKTGIPYKRSITIGDKVVYHVWREVPEVSIWETYKVDLELVNCPGGVLEYYNNGVCAAKTLCTPGQFVVSDGDVITDRECRPCPVGSFSNINNAVACVAHYRCTQFGVYKAVEGTPTTDSICGSIKNCTAGTFVTMYPKYDNNEAISNMVCSACEPGKFSNEINSVECISYTDCLPPFYIISEGTNKANTVCEKCALGTFTRKKNQKTCTPYVLVPLYFVFFFVPFALLLFSGIQQLLKI